MKKNETTIILPSFTYDSIGERRVRPESTHIEGDPEELSAEEVQKALGQATGWVIGNAENFENMNVLKHFHDSKGR